MFNSIQFYHSAELNDLLILLVLALVSLPCFYFVQH